MYSHIQDTFHCNEVCCLWCCCRTEGEGEESVTGDRERACFPRDLLDNRDDLSSSSNEGTSDNRCGEDGRGVCVCVVFVTERERERKWREGFN